MDRERTYGGARTCTLLGDSIVRSDATIHQCSVYLLRSIYNGEHSCSVEAVQSGCFAVSYRYHSVLFAFVQCVFRIKPTATTLPFPQSEAGSRETQSRDTTVARADTGDALATPSQAMHGRTRILSQSRTWLQ